MFWIFTYSFWVFKCFGYLTTGFGCLNVLDIYFQFLGV